MRAFGTLLAFSVLCLAPVAWASPDLGSDAQRAEGKELYDKYCSQCHGDPDRQLAEVQETSLDVDRQIANALRTQATCFEVVEARVRAREATASTIRSLHGVTAKKRDGKRNANDESIDDAEVEQERAGEALAHLRAAIVVH